MASDGRAASSVSAAVARASKEAVVNQSVPGEPLFESGQHAAHERALGGIGQRIALHAAERDSCEPERAHRPAYGPAEPHALGQIFEAHRAVGGRERLVQQLIHQRLFGELVE